MSDYANLQEKYYYAMNPPPPEGGAMSRDGMADVLRREREAYKNRNPDPKPEPALLLARTQAEWHTAQQALIDSQTSPEALMLSQGMVEGTDAAAQQGEKIQEQRRKDAEERLKNAKRDLEQMRKGEFRAGGIGRSGLPPASTPGTVPAPVQGQIPPTQEMQRGMPQGPTPQQQMPGQEAQRQVGREGEPQRQEPTHQEAHHQAARAHEEAAGVHQGHPHRDNPVGDDEAQRAHREQAARHEVDAQGTPNAPGAMASEADRAKAEGREPNNTKRGK